MNCYECAIEGEALGTVAICKHCGVGMCLEHFQLAREYRVGGTTLGCSHHPAAPPQDGLRKRARARRTPAAAGSRTLPAAGARRAPLRPAAGTI